MCPWLYLIHFLSKLRAACMNSIRILVQNLKGRPMGYQEVNFRRNGRPNLFRSRAVVLESPVVKQGLIWGPEYLYPLYLNELMLQVCAMLLQFFKLALGIQFLMRMAFGFMLKLVVFNVVNEVMIASDYYLMLVGKFFKELYEPIELSSITILSKITSMHKDIRLGQLGNVHILMEVMSITHGHYSHHL